MLKFFNINVEYFVMFIRSCNRTLVVKHNAMREQDKSTRDDIASKMILMKNSKNLKARRRDFEMFCRELKQVEVPENEDALQVLLDLQARVVNIKAQYIMLDEEEREKIPMSGNLTPRPPVDGYNRIFSPN